MGEQPNPWELDLPLLLTGQDYTFTMTLLVAKQILGANRVISALIISKIETNAYLILSTKINKNQSLRELLTWIIAAKFFRRLLDRTLNADNASAN